MLQELLNNPDTYATVTFKDLENFIEFGLIVVLAVLICEIFVNTIHKIIGKIKKKLNTFEEEMEENWRYKSCKNWSKFCDNSEVCCKFCASYELDEDLWQGDDD